MCEILELNLCNLMKFKNQDLISKFKILKNDLKFKNILLKN